MNKYASGYTLIQILSVIGWFVIVISVIGGIFISLNAERGMVWVGISVAVAGSFQGLLLLGIGAVGTAILDGSVASQRNIEIQERSNLSNSNSALDRNFYDDIRFSIEMMRFISAASLGKPGLSFVEVSYGSFIFKNVDGTYLVNEEVYESLENARIDLKKHWLSTKNNANMGDDVVYNGYRIAYSQGRYLINGTSFKSPNDVIEYLDKEIRYGGYKISGYKIPS